MTINEGKISQSMHAGGQSIKSDLMAKPRGNKKQEGIEGGSPGKREGKTKNGRGGGRKTWGVNQFCKCVS